MCGIDAPSFFLSIVPSSSARSFTVERKNNVFLKNGEPFRYISGSSDYFLLEGQTGVDEGSWSECFDNVSGNAFFQLTMSVDLKQLVPGRKLFSCWKCFQKTKV